MGLFKARCLASGQFRNREFTIYAVSQFDGKPSANPYFLIWVPFRNHWQWMPSSEFVPVEE